ncbi:MAG: hypothetical protein AAFZ15_16715 [Bacteroidota bacterium]
MHDIEPYHRWRHKYVSSEDQLSPFFGRTYDEFFFTQKIYNYFIHPQWDGFGSATLYMKILMADYEKGYAIFEMLGEWNDCLHNDVMFLKRDVVDEIMPSGINKFIIIAENVLNFHAGDDDYYEEWYDDVKEEGGWIALVNVLPHVEEELKEINLKYYVNYGGPLNDINWRAHTPKTLLQQVENLLVKRLD